MKTDSQNVTWTDIERLAKLLSKKISVLSKDFSSISTISRGGLVPARLMADHMGIDTILVDKNKIPPDSLFVDDIYDSGDTFKKIIPKVTDPSNFVYAKKTKGNEYIVYPWDKMEYRRLKDFAL